MTDHPQIRLQRATGEIRASWHMRNGQTHLNRLRQQGSSKAIPLPGPEVVLLNTAGGLTGGDHLSFNLEIGDDCQLTATTQTAERLYRAPEGVARMEVNLRAGTRSCLEWLPQETIAFQGSNTRRDTRIDLGEDASCLTCETLVLGRAAMGEVVDHLHLQDWRHIRRKGTPIYLDPLTLDADRLPSLQGARAIGSVVMIAQGIEDAIGPVRACLTEAGVITGASAFDGRLICRLLAPDAYPMRRQMVRLLTLLRKRPLPRVWQL